MKRLAFIFISLALAQAALSDNCVILLHGLSRTEHSMNGLAEEAEKVGFKVVNESYPSRSAEISALSEFAIPNALSQCSDDDQVSFVTHSMGGILLRDYFARHQETPRPYRVVMLAPPNQGSEIIDDPKYETFGAWWMGPAGQQLSADPSSFVKNLPAVDYPTGVIAGNASINPYFSNILPGEDDGAVSVQNTQVDGMTDRILVKANHSFMMSNSTVISQTLYFLQNGEFDKSTAK